MFLDRLSFLILSNPKFKKRSTSDSHNLINNKEANVAFLKTSPWILEQDMRNSLEFRNHENNQVTKTLNLSF